MDEWRARFPRDDGCGETHHEAGRERLDRRCARADADDDETETNGNSRARSAVVRPRADVARRASRVSRVRFLSRKKRCGWMDGCRKNTLANRETDERRDDRWDRFHTRRLRLERFESVLV